MKMNLAIDNTQKEIESTKKYLYGHISPETAYEVDDYPWGFRLRTKIRYWIETKKDFGDRFVSQTINPKTGRWCNPKKMTYSQVKVLYLNEKNHVNCESVGTYADETWLNKFKDRHLENLNELQKHELKVLLSMNQVMKHVEVKFECTRSEPVSLFSQKPEDVEKRRLIAEQQEERKKQRKKDEEYILRAVNHTYNNMQL